MHIHTSSPISHHPSLSLSVLCLCIYVSRYVCIYVCMYVCMHVCMYVCRYMYDSVMYACVLVCVCSCLCPIICLICLFVCLGAWQTDGCTDRAGFSGRDRDSACAMDPTAMSHGLTCDHILGLIRFFVGGLSNAEASSRLSRTRATSRLSIGSLFAQVLQSGIYKIV